MGDYKKIFFRSKLKKPTHYSLDFLVIKTKTIVPIKNANHIVHNLTNNVIDVLRGNEIF